MNASSSPTKCLFRPDIVSHLCAIYTAVIQRTIMAELLNFTHKCGESVIARAQFTQPCMRFFPRKRTQAWYNSTPSQASQLVGQATWRQQKHSRLYGHKVKYLAYNMTSLLCQLHNKEKRLGHCNITKIKL
jgi:hypothetical protein